LISLKRFILLFCVCNLNFSYTFQTILVCNILSITTFTSAYDPSKDVLNNGWWKCLTFAYYFPNFEIINTSLLLIFGFWFNKKLRLFLKIDFWFFLELSIDLCIQFLIDFLNSFHLVSLLQNLLFLLLHYFLLWIELLLASDKKFLPLFILKEYL